MCGTFSNVSAPAFEQIGCSHVHRISCLFPWKLYNFPRRQPQRVYHFKNPRCDSTMSCNKNNYQLFDSKKRSDICQFFALPVKARNKTVSNRNETKKPNVVAPISACISPRLTTQQHQTRQWALITLAIPSNAHQPETSTCSVDSTTK